MGFLKGQAQVMTESVTQSKPHKISGKPDRWYFALMAARPKADITFPKKPVGIPEAAQTYLFAQNHISVAYMTEAEKKAFQACILQLADEDKDEDWRRFSVFLKIFYEGGFAYNRWQTTPGG